ncbi:MAG: zinc metallopeptidase, partial [Kangiellaceae bacterium]|nr:zinc metallopeptidase [Kangiellaceae bacterium]
MQQLNGVKNGFVSESMYILILLVILAVVFIPQWWVRYVLKKHAKPLPAMPGTGGELAQHLLDKYELSNVNLEEAEEGADHYDPQSNTVRLSPSYLNGKSLTAVAVAAHEVGHAIQFNRQEPVSFLRRKYLTKAHSLQKIGAAVLMALPLIAMIIRIPHLMAITALVGLITLLCSVFAYAAILPEEWDASFNKALPILRQGNYVPDKYIPAIQQTLRACALTYVAAALADIL